MSLTLRSTNVAYASCTDNHLVSPLIHHTARFETTGLKYSSTSRHNKKTRKTDTNKSKRKYMNRLCPHIFAHKVYNTVTFLFYLSDNIIKLPLIHDYFVKSYQELSVRLHSSLSLFVFLQTVIGC